MRKVKEVSPQEARKIIETREPLGLFYRHDYDTNVYVGIDNSTGDAWVEEFTDIRACARWLTLKWEGADR